ncbi:MAG: ATP-dependent Clp protease proteolytic subunit [Lachnospiraceae bacterium]|nr:ATP-dependent Clp protease proteolytic subunit [Lachnospiraceae bacterium]MCI5587307.1 ATP-dependent Clp protease proteolytic subunit [Lachnospiraceae bacterium]
MDNNINEYGIKLLTGKEGEPTIQLISIIGEIEGHECASNTSKTTKYEHMLPILAGVEFNEEIDGVLFLINTVGGDVSCGLALAEIIASMSKPTVALVIGDSHSIGVPLSVAADYTFIAPSATVIIHPVRMSGPVLGAPQTVEYFKLTQNRITEFIAKHSEASKEDIERWMVTPGILSRDLGTILVGEEAVRYGVFQETGGISDALAKLKSMISVTVAP